ncbi:MAG TPA: YciI family protein [Terriglobales bacterium]|nr:YciI family protein [Terriglobales bacterium]
MKVMVIVKANEQSEAGILPDTELLANMTKYNEQLVKAGIMLSGDGLQPSSKGKRVKFLARHQPTVTDGPFAETKELIAGFWIWKVKSIDEAVEWLKRAPFNRGEVVEIRPFHTLEDFGENLTPELRAENERLCEMLGSKP